MGPLMDDDARRYDEITEQIAKLERERAQLEVKVRQRAMQQVRALMEQYGLTQSDFEKPQRAKSVPLKPRYRDPVSGATWSGMGRIPEWIKDKNRDDFLIERSTAPGQR